MVQNGIFLTIGEQSYFVYYPIISYQRIKVYRVEKWIWEDPTVTIVSLGCFLYPLVLQYLLYKIRYFGSISNMIYVHTCNYTLNNVRFLVINISKEHGYLITSIKKLHPYEESHRLLHTFYTMT